MRKIFLLITIGYIFLFSCQKQKNIHFPVKSKIYGLASIVNLEIDSTIIYLDDYFLSGSEVQKIDVPQGMAIKHGDSNKVIIYVKEPDKVDRLTTLRCWIGEDFYDIVLRKSPKIRYEYVFDPKGKSYKSVKIKGQFNSWNSNANVFVWENNVWKTQIIAQPGVYEYKLILDGFECLDPNNPDSVSNNIGGFNSVLKIGEVPENKPFLQTYSFKNNEIRIKTQGNIDKVLVLWQNYLLPKCYFIKKKAEIVIKVPKQAKSLDYSYIRVFAFNKDAESNDVIVPLKKGEIIKSVSDLWMYDWRKAIIYNVFVDRFFDGDKTNNKPINNPTLVHPKADYHGGDIAGITQILEKGYFDSLAVNTLWISPIVKNVDGAYGFWPKPKTKFSAYHGYWPLYFTKIDERFGTEAQFKELVDKLHSRNKYLLLDFVAHHVHEKSPFYQQNKDKVTPLYLPDGSLNTERWDDYRLTTWFDVFLPTLDNSNPEVANIITDSALWWMITYNIDGFRHDAAKHVPLSFWRLLTYKIKRYYEYSQNVKTYQIGETYGSNELIGSYLGSGLLDAQFDFNVYDAIVRVLVANKSFRDLERELLKSFYYYGWHNIMGYITGNQDRGRFISYAGGSLKLDENPKVAGWTRNIDVGDTIGYTKAKLLFAFIGTMVGVPVIYYGDEIGMPGGNDPDNRRMMIFSNLNNHQVSLLQTARKIMNLRANNMALIYGQMSFVEVADSYIVYKRQYFDKVAFVVLNNSAKYIKVMLPYVAKEPLKANFGSKTSALNKYVTVEVAPYSFEVLTN
ncbi:MAG: alpha-amylase family glycosyl hydrolase [Candidatus Micrarchaeia archaeon]